MPRTQRLLILANRLPVSRVGGGHGEWQISPGGLVAALEPVLRRQRGLWIGWAGVGGPAPRIGRVNGLDLEAVPISESELTTFYQGFCNRTLWPLYHDAIRTPEFERAWWEPYVRVNQRFAAQAARRSSRRDLVWVHDFHLQLVPGMLRQRRPESRTGFFMHIPFPPEELFLWLPWREEIVRGLLGADVVGFQTQSDAQNFSRVARRLGLAEGTDTELLVPDGRTVRVGAFPISIDFGAFDALGRDDTVVAAAAKLRRRVGARRKILLAVDRLDYTKGIENRLLAFEELLRSRRLSARRCVLMQIAVPSREIIPDYAETRDRVERIVGRINGEFSEPGSVAVHYFRRSYDRRALAAYYAAADVLLATPLRDGMNLVCKEFVATRTENTGVLVLSEFAGASRQLRRSLLVNPRDTEGLAEAILEAVRMDRAEAQQRMVLLRMMVRRHDVDEWAEEFLGKLRA